MTPYLVDGDAAIPPFVSMRALPLLRAPEDVPGVAGHPAAELLPRTILVYPCVEDALHRALSDCAWANIVELLRTTGPLGLGGRASPVTPDWYAAIAALRDHAVAWVLLSRFDDAFGHAGRVSRDALYRTVADAAGEAWTRFTGDPVDVGRILKLAAELYAFEDALVLGGALPAATPDVLRTFVARHSLQEVL